VERFELLFRDATVIDGTGAPRFEANVGVRGERIAAVGDLAEGEAAVTIQASGKMLAPGFVDMHSHSDRTLVINPRAEAAVRQGVSLEVIGNCGMSAGGRWRTPASGSTSLRWSATGPSAAP
jgi:N-acyl-D-amino-acid deacylase